MTPRRSPREAPLRQPVRASLRTCLIGAALGALAPSLSAAQPVAQLPHGASVTVDVAEPTVAVTVRGRSKADRMRESAEAVKVVELGRVKTQSADLGDVLARTPGVSVRRTGGLGSGLRFSLNGLQDEQIRFFYDGVPLELMGYAFGIANVPVNLLSRVEIYAGVVPVRFGADALGGAVNLVGDEGLRGTRTGASYQFGSFGTHRATMAAQHVHAPSGFFARLDGYFDEARNDYDVDVRVANDLGQLADARIARRHDAYRALGGGGEVGFVRRPWAKRLSLRGFVSDYHKQLQHDFAMRTPFGAATSARTSAGAILRYEQDFGDDWSMEAAAGHAWSQARIRDVSTCVYDWYGRCVRQRDEPGELADYAGSNGSDSRLDRHSVYVRANLAYRPREGHALRLSLAPTFFRQSGQDLRLRGTDVRDSLQAKRTVASVVTGLEYELNALDDRLQSTTFVKQYFQRSELAAGGGQWEDFAARHHQYSHFGGGSGLRVRLTSFLLAKASYEYAIRVPRSDEQLGEPPFTKASLDLEPERGHNANLGASFDLRETKLGAFRAGATGFVRYVDSLIVLLENSPSDLYYTNLYSARSRGVESNVGWTSPHDYFSIDGNLTRQSFVNTSSRGTLAVFKGKQMPQRPSLFANLEARLCFRDVFVGRDELSLTERTNWISSFDRGWGGSGLAQYKDRIADQLQHALALTYLFRLGRTGWSATVEGQNLADAKAFDFFGVQKPGRAFYGKLTAHVE